MERLPHITSPSSLGMHKMRIPVALLSALFLGVLAGFKWGGQFHEATPLQKGPDVAAGASNGKKDAKSQAADAQKVPEEGSTYGMFLAQFAKGKTDCLLIHRVLESLARRDPAEALRLAKEWEARGVANCTRHALFGWALGDPDAAWRHASQDKTTRTHLYGLSDMLAKDGQFETAARLAFVESDPRLRQRLIANLATVWATASPQDFLAWFNTIAGSDDARRSGTGGFLGGVAKIDLATAQHYVETDPDPVQRGQLAATIVAQMLSDGHTEAAAKWAADIGEPRALGLIATTISGSNLARATELINQMPEGAERNMAISQIGYTVYNNEPAKRFVFLELMTGSERLFSLLKIAADWTRIDSSTASNYIQQSPRLSLTEKEKLLGPSVKK